MIRPIIVAWSAAIVVARTLGYDLTDTCVSTPSAGVQELGRRQLLCGVCDISEGDRASHIFTGEDSLIVEANSHMDVRRHSRPFRPDLRVLEQLTTRRNEETTTWKGRYCCCVGKLRQS
jgi:hypothetical protein